MVNFEFSFCEKILIKIGWYKFCNFIENWIYPAYNLKNLLFNRYNTVKIPQVKAWEYTDKEYLMLCANMQIIVDFIEKENPEKHICWYKDEDGVECGHKYGENPDYNILFPEYKGEWIMDIIKEIYNYWKEIYPKQYDCKEYLLGYWSKYLCGTMMSVQDEENEDMYNVVFDKTNVPKTKEDLYDLKLDWNKLDYVVGNREKLLDNKYIYNRIKELEKEIFNDCQKYLHLCIEIRPYLWT
jgi:hypothetical protein